MFISTMKSLIRNAFLIIVILAPLVGCAVKDDDDDSDIGNNIGNGSNNDSNNNGGKAAVFNITADANSNGLASVSFDLPAGTTKFSVSALVPDAGSIRFTEVQDSRNNNYLSPGTIPISMSTEFFNYVNEVSVPSRSNDPALADSQTYIVSAQARTSSNAPAAGEQLTFAVNSKVDRDLNSGSLHINLFYVGDLGNQAEVKNVVTLAMQHFNEIYAAQAGIGLILVENEISGPTTLPDPIEGDSFYQDASSSAYSPAVNIFVGGDIAGRQSMGTVDTLGLSPGIPGPPIPSERSAIAVSYIAGASPISGTYAAEDIRILGETMAHETGHYLGLFHPVDFSGTTVTATDPLTDTPSCTTSTNCLSNATLIDNLMYPQPISLGQGRYRPQYKLTTQQRGVMNRYIVVD